VQAGGGDTGIPFLNFADKYTIAGSMLSPAILGTKDWTQIISSIQAGDALGSQIKQTANVITAVICKTTGNVPASVCGQDSITALTDSLVSYTTPSVSSGSELLLPDTAFESASMP
jgi:butyrate kinase